MVAKSLNDEGITPNKIDPYSFLLQITTIITYAYNLMSGWDKQTQLSLIFATAFENNNGVLVPVKESEHRTL